MSITGEPERSPVRVGISIGDLAAGMYAAIAVNAALYHRAQRGEGTRIDVAMFDCQVALMDSPVVRHAATGEIPGPLGARHPSISPFEAYTTADAPLVIAAGNNRLFDRLAHTLELPSLATDPRFATNDERARNAALLAVELEARLRQQPRAHWLALLDKAAIPCAPINNVAELMEIPQVRARNMLITVEDLQCGSVTATGNPMKFSGFLDPVTSAGAPRHDEHRWELLAYLGVAAPAAIPLAVVFTTLNKRR
jgi:CoA:oxalate CoA-transferase